MLHILITPEDAISDEYSEKFSEMEDLKSEYGELAFTVNVEGGEGADRLSEIKTEYNKLKADADKIKDEHLAPSVEKAKEAYAKLQAGEEFSKVAKEYSPIPRGNENGLLISVKHSGSYDWSKEVKDAFAKIKQGEYTEPVKDDEGVHILYYLSDEPAGEVGLDSVKDKIKEILMIDVQEDEWNQMLETWKNDESVSPQRRARAQRHLQPRGGGLDRYKHSAGQRIPGCPVCFFATYVVSFRKMNFGGRICVWINTLKSQG